MGFIGGFFWWVHPKKTTWFFWVCTRVSEPWLSISDRQLTDARIILFILLVFKQVRALSETGDVVSPLSVSWLSAPTGHIGSHGTNSASTQVTEFYKHWHHLLVLTFRRELKTFLFNISRQLNPT